MVSKEEVNQMRWDEDIPGLLAALSDHKSSVRADAASGLGMLQALEALRPLTKLLDDKKSYVKGNSASAIAELYSNKSMSFEEKRKKFRGTIKPMIRNLDDDGYMNLPHLIPAIGKMSAIMNDDDRKICGDKLIKIMNDPASRVNSNCAKTLTKLGYQPAIPHIIALLTSDDDDWVISSYVESLGILGDIKQIEPISKLRKHKSWMVRLAVVKALSKFGLDAKPYIEKACRDRKNEVKLAANKALATIEALEGKPISKEKKKAKKLMLLDDRAYDVRREAASSLYSDDNRSIYRRTLNVIVSENDKIKRERYIELLENDKCSDIDVLLALIDCSNEKSRIGVIEALGEYKDTKALFALLEQLNLEIKTNIQRKIVIAISKQGDIAVEHLMKIWPKKNLRTTILLALGKTKNPKVIPFMKNALDDDDQDVRESAVTGLGSIGKVSLKTLIEIYHQYDGNIKAEAINQIAKLDGVANQELINSALSDKSWEVRRAAAYQLGEIEGARLTPELLKAVNDRKSNVRYAAIIALGKIGDVSAFETVEARYNDRDESVAYVAEKVLNNFLYTGATGMGLFQDHIFVCLAIAHLGVEKPSDKAMERIVNFVFLCLFSEAEKRTVEPGEELLITWDGSDPLSQQYQKTLEDGLKFYKMLFEAKGGEGILFAFRRCVMIIGRNNRNHPAQLRALHDFLSELASEQEPLPEMSKAFLEYLEQNWFGDEKKKKPARKQKKSAEKPKLENKLIPESESEINRERDLEKIIICGNRFVITGAYPGLTREDFESLLYQHGGILQKSITKQTDYLIIGDKPGTSKISKALNLRVPSIEAEQFQEILADSKVIKDAIKSEQYAETPLDLSAINQKDKNTRIQILKQIGRNKYVDGAQTLIEVLRENEPDIQKAAITSIIELGEPAITKLVKTLADDDFGSFFDSFDLISQILTAPMRKKILQNKGIRHTGTKDVATFRLRCVMELERQLQDGNLQCVIDALDDKRKEVPAIAANVLGRNKVNKAINELIEKIHGKNHTLAEAAVVALGRIGDSVVYEILLGLIDDKRKSIVVAAINALGELGDRRAVEPLIELCTKRTKKDYFVVHVSIGALVKIGDKKAIEPLAKICKERINNNPFTKRPLL